MPTLLERKQQLVRDAIWDAAMDLFARRGFDDTTVDDIAEAAGVSRRSFFRYFASKNDLMAQGIVSYGQTLSDAIRACPRSHSPAEVLRETVHQVAREAAAQPRTRVTIGIAAKYPAAREAQLSRMAELEDRVAEAYAQRAGRRSGNDPAPRVLAGLTLSVLSVTFRSWFEQGGQDISATADGVLATLRRLICDHKGRG